jgi:phosphoglycolate phosphatase-like HAD superfamily hydrolase
MNKVFYHMTKGLPIKGVLFDMDGTLTVPVLDFAGTLVK